MEVSSEKNKLKGWSIETRINARAPGKVQRLEVPGGIGVRFDSFLYNGYTVLPHYDSMIAKLIVHDTNRERALKKMLRALDELVIDGVPTNIEEQKSILTSKKFMSGQFGTSLYTELFPDKAV
jgi:acetyl-CoA carboxylase biotin carboxylase subunit